MDTARLRVGIVGGSLAGLACANRLERAGAQVTVLERGPATFADRGGGLGVPLDLVSKVIGHSEKPPPHLVHLRRRVRVYDTEREEPSHIVVTSYGAYWRHLRHCLQNTEVRHGQAVFEVEETANEVRVRGHNGWSDVFDLLLLADGGASELRRHVDPTENRKYSGYVLWRGLVAANAVDEPRFGLLDRFNIANRGTKHFVAYAIPSYGGQTAAEERLLNWGLYHPTPDVDEFLAGVRSLAPHEFQHDPAVLRRFDQVAGLAENLWPDWVAHVLTRTVAEGVIAPHPVFERSPDKLATGRVVLVGDAAHLASPITGGGARMAMEDAWVLGESLHAAPNLPAALHAYEQARRPGGALVVAAGRARGAAFRGVSKDIAAT